MGSREALMLGNDPRSGLADRYQIENDCLLTAPVFDESSFETPATYSRDSRMASNMCDR
jgi:hypothetical protein